MMCPTLTSNAGLRVHQACWPTYKCAGRFRGTLHSEACGGRGLRAHATEGMLRTQLPAPQAHLHHLPEGCLLAAAAVLHLKQHVQKRLGLECLLWLGILLELALCGHHSQVMLWAAHCSCALPPGCHKKHLSATLYAARLSWR